MSIFKKIKDWLRKPLVKNEKIISPLGVSLPDRPSSSRLAVKKCRNSKPMRKAVEDTNTAFPFNTNTAFPFNINTAFPFNINPLYPNSMLSGRHTTRSRTEDLDDTTTRNNSSSDSYSSSSDTSSSYSSSSDTSSSYSSSSDSSSSCSSSSGSSSSSW